ncbi:hypothetical protein GGI07_005370 [Coemansia sp. Benny D115]|nr:hypothetical protein GGI07_005370 [Coemansia sp. Benny D115]
MSLAHSLLHSRKIWLTKAFTPISQLDFDQPRELLGTVEMQIGPFVFSNTRFYLVSPPPETQSPEGTFSTDVILPPPLAFEFAEGPGELFCLPKDFGVDRKYSGSLRVLGYFYANPTQPYRRRPSNIRQDWPHYYLAEKNLIRINVVIRFAENPLVDALLEYTDAHRTTVWREYQKTLCQPQPLAKFYDQFFPASENKAKDGLDPRERVPKPTILQPQPDSLARSEASDAPKKEEHAIQETAALLATEAHLRGGKGGYNLQVASLLWKDRAESESSASSESEGEDNGRDKRPLELPDVKMQPTKNTASLRVLSGGSAAVPAKARRTASSTAVRDRVCKYCGCNETPIWRRGPAGTGTLCNACGVKWKLGKILQ